MQLLQDKLGPSQKKEKYASGWSIVTHDSSTSKHPTLSMKLQI
jgi:hypothetical protein